VRYLGVEVDDALEMAEQTEEYRSRRPLSACLSVAERPTPDLHHIVVRAADPSFKLDGNCACDTRSGGPIVGIGCKAG
jgi:hypothetical protein